MSRYKPVGWKNESHRHYLAAKGIRTRSGRLGSVNGVQIVARKLPEGQVYPVAPDAVRKYLARCDPADVRGLKAIEFAPPRDREQKDAWAQYKRGKKTVVVFSQPVKRGLVSGKDPVKVDRMMRGYVLPHEVGHHVALRDLPTDGDVRVAEARADAHAFGLDVRDRDVRRFVQKV